MQPVKPELTQEIEADGRRARGEIIGRLVDRELRRLGRRTPPHDGCRRNRRRLPRRAARHRRARAGWPMLRPGCDERTTARRCDALARTRIDERGLRARAALHILRTVRVGLRPLTRPARRPDGAPLHTPRARHGEHRTRRAPPRSRHERTSSRARCTSASPQIVFVSAIRSAVPRPRSALPPRHALARTRCQRDSPRLSFSPSAPPTSLPRRSRSARSSASTPLSICRNPVRRAPRFAKTASRMRGSCAQPRTTTTPTLGSMLRCCKARGPPR
jgi:hypothetical protein